MKSNSELYLEQYKDIYDNKIIFNDKLIPKNSLELFYNEIKNCSKCSLSKSRTKLVFGVGDSNADIVIVGEAPGKNEDLEGEPFVGRSGKLLDKILEAVGLNRKKVFILNVVKCRPPENRDPKPKEISECEPYLKKQLELIKPKLIVALGRIAAITLLDSKDSLTNMRNKIHKYENIDLLVTYHPAALLRNPNFKKPTWEDFKIIRDRYINGNK